MQSVLNKIRNFKFPFYIISRNAYLEVSRLYSDNLKARLEKDVLIERVKSLQEERDSLVSQLGKTHWDIVADMSDPSPVDTEEYKACVSEVAGFHTRVLQPKMLHSISMAYKLMEDSSDHSFNDRLKGTVYGLREIMRWGESMVNKQLEFSRKEDEEFDGSSFSSSKIISDILDN